MFANLVSLCKLVEGTQIRTSLERLNEGLPDSYKYGLAVCYDSAGHYVGVKLSEGLKNVIYKSGPPNGYDFTAVSKFAGETEKGIKRIGRCLSEMAQKIESREFRAWFKSVADEHERNIEKISQDAELILNTLDTRESYPFFYVAEYREGVSHPTPLYSFPVIENFVVDSTFDSYGRVGKNDSSQSLKVSNKACSICGKMAKVVFGNFSFLTCYNLDKPGMIAGGFDSKLAYRNFPVCEDCVTSVTAGYVYADRKLRFHIGGLKYLLLPILHVEDQQLSKEILSRFEERSPTPSLQEENLSKITGDEKEILEYLSEEGLKNLVSFNLVFYEESNAAWRITAEISEVLPSRVRKLYDVKRLLESKNIQDQQYKVLQMGKKPFSFTFSTIRRFAAPDGTESNSRLLHLIDTVFTGKKIDRRAFLSDILRAILKTAKKEWSLFPFVVRDAWACDLFFQKLDCYINGGNTVTEPILAIDSASPYNEFLSIHPEFFNYPAKQAAFLTGFYVAKVLSVQQKERGSQPFLPKFQGMKIDQKKLMKLFSEARSKLIHYGKLGYVIKPGLDTLLARVWTECSRWDLSSDETTFHFCLGLALDYNISANQSPETDELKEKSA